MVRILRQADVCVDERPALWVADLKCNGIFFLSPLETAEDAAAMAEPPEETGMDNSPQKNKILQRRIALLWKIQMMNE